ncbi:MAG: DUF1587 domain-containing protein, partial [Verrucomicrobiota bacterium]
MPESLKSLFFPRAAALLLTATLISSLAHASTATTGPIAAMPDEHFEFFGKYCVSCHDDINHEGNLDLYEVDFDLGTIESAETWQKILNSINSGEMPPKKKKQPTDEEKTAFLAELSHQLVEARALLSDTGGEITMRRLNHREYENTVSELLGITVVADELPEDTNPGGFDTAGGSLFFSSDQFEQYLVVARRALAQALPTDKKPNSQKLRSEAEEHANRTVTNRLNNHVKNWERAEAWRASDQDPTDFGFIDSDRVKFEV